MRPFAEELAPARADIIQRPIDLYIIPDILKKKTSVIILVPKRPGPQEYTDYCLVALTCIVMRCLERIMLKKFKEEVKDHLDLCQFAYQINWGTDVAILTVVHHVSKHLEDPKANARLS